MKETLPKSIQELILSLREKLKDEPEIVDMFERCYSNTLDTTVKKMEDGSTYVITGDIPAMWLRDSVYKTGTVKRSRTACSPYIFRFSYPAVWIWSMWIRW